MQRHPSRRRFLCRVALLVAACCTLGIQAARAEAPPITIGFGMSLTGGLAANGKSALLAMKIWAEDRNAKGGLLGRPVKLIYYDEQSDPATVPGIYTKLLDVDKVDLVIGGYATNTLAPAMPVVMQHGMAFIGLFGLAVNTEFQYPRYFSMIPAGPDPKAAFSKDFFELAAAQTPKPQTVAIVAADADFSRNAADGARANATAGGFKIVYDASYPPKTMDFSPIVRAIQAQAPDIVYVASYPPDSVGIIRAAHEIGLRPKLFGGGMVGLQSTALKTQLGPLLNGIVNYEFWLPAPTMQFPGIADLLARYQARAASEGVDPLGYYMAPYAYAYLQVLAQAVEGTKGLDQDAIATWIHGHSFTTVVGENRFGDDGEWAQGRTLLVQFQNITDGSLARFREPDAEVVLAPAAFKSGSLMYPYAPIPR